MVCFFFFPLKSVLNLLQCCFCFMFCFFFWLWGMWDASCLSRDWTRTFCIGKWSLNHWIPRKVPLRCTFWLMLSLPFRKVVPVYSPRECLLHHSLAKTGICRPKGEKRRETGGSVFYQHPYARDTCSFSNISLSPPCFAFAHPSRPS